VAGIGFELRRLMRQDSLTNIARSYGYAGLVGSGPWVSSVGAMLMVGAATGGLAEGQRPVASFLHAVTCLTAASLVLTGPLQLMFTRFVSDRLYEERREAVLPNTLGALTVTTLVSGAAAGLALPALSGLTPTARLLLLAAFVLACDAWLLVALMTGLKAYGRVLAAFCGANAIGAAGSLLLAGHGLEGLLVGWLLGQSVLTFSLLALVTLEYGAERLVAWDFLNPAFAKYDLAAAGLLWNAGIWVDKLLFWLHPATSAPVLGPLRHSLIYDLPAFLAYLTVVPGMSVFLMRMETDFFEQFQLFFGAVRGGGTLADLRRSKEGMVLAVRMGLWDIAKVQGLTLVAALASADALLSALGLPAIHRPLLNVDLAGVALQVVLVALVGVLFHLDKRRGALAVVALFALANALLTAWSLRLGPAFYGYGTAVAALVASLPALALVDRALARLEFDTFMGQPG
jgi:uncharacterized membrane protein